MSPVRIDPDSIVYYRDGVVDEEMTQQARRVARATAEAELGPRTKKATDRNIEAGDANRARAAELRDQGLSRRQIAVAMAREHGRVDENGDAAPYDTSQIRRWLRPKKGDTAT